MGVIEKIGEIMQQNEEKKKGLRNSILKLLLEWENFEKDFYMSTTCLKECFNELDAKEKKLNAVQESVVESSKELDSIRESVDKRREAIEAKEEQFRVFCDKESRNLECRWEEFSILVKEKEFEERSKELNKIESWIHEETDALLLKEREFKERVEEFEIKEKALQSLEKEMSLECVMKELMAKENCLDNVKETELDSVKKECNLDSIQKEFRENETNLDSVKKQLRIKEDRLSLVKKEIEIKEKIVDTINKELELREQELISFQERIQLWEGELNSIQNDSWEKKLDSVSVAMQTCDVELEKENFQKEQGLLKNIMEDIALKEKQVEVRFRELEQREKLIDDRFKVLEEKEKQLKTICNVPVKTEPIDNVEENRVGAITGDSSDISFLVTMGGKSLQIYLNEREKALDTMSDEVFKALQLSPDPGQLVLEAMEGFYPPHLRKGDTEFEGNVTRQSCILLLEQLIRVSPKIEPIVLVEAYELAKEWKVKLRAMAENQFEILGFLYLLAAYSLAPAFDTDELVSLLTIVVEHNKSKDLCRLLGFTEKISCFIESFIKSGELLLAFTYIYEFELVGSFSPVLLLKNYVLRSIKQAKKTNNGCCPRKVQKKVKAAVECIEQHSLQSGYSPDELRARILEIERLMENPHESPCAPSPHATVSTRVQPNSSHLTQHYVPDPRVPPSNFRAPNLHPSLFLQHNRLDAPPGGMSRNYSGPTDHLMAPSGVPQPFLPTVNPFYHQHTPRSPNVIHPSYFS